MNKLRGVNLGGWLVAERWMTPSLFEGSEAKDEHSLLQEPGGAKKIAKHQKDFIKESDFAWIKSASLNAVRIPVGYWCLENDAPYVACAERLDWAMKMAKKYDLQVLISLHGAPGSQNGHDHSGRIGDANWYAHKIHRHRTIEVLEKLVLRYNDQPNFWGIELMNEPKPGLLQLKLRHFYKQAYDRLCKIARPGLSVVYSDAFSPRLLSGAINPRPSNPVFLDIHWYHFTFWLHRVLPLKFYWHLVKWHGRLINNLKKAQGIIIGEWSMVISTEALRKYPTEKHQELMDIHTKIQLDAYENADGWFYWTYKTEGRGLWNFRSMVEDGHIHLDDEPTEVYNSSNYGHSI